jgi:hypothetical protein
MSASPSHPSARGRVRDVARIRLEDQDVGVPPPQPRQQTALDAQVSGPAEKVDVLRRREVSDLQLTGGKDRLGGPRRSGDDAQPSAAGFGQSVEDGGSIRREDPLLKPDAPGESRSLTPAQFRPTPQVDRSHTPSIQESRVPRSVFQDGSSSTSDSQRARTPPRPPVSPRGRGAPRA